MAIPPPSPPAPRIDRWRVTVLFSDLSDSTALAGRLEPEEYLDVLHHLHRSTDAVLRKYGGALVAFHGDGLLAMFGYPDASPDDGRRATEAALELHAAIAQPLEPLPAGVQPLAMHSGIHSGLVLVIEEGHPVRYSLVGEAVNIAARLSDMAESNEILVSATTLGMERNFFAVRERGVLRLEGKSEPVPTLQVIGRGEATTRFQARARHGLTPLAGRDAELATLERALAEARAGRLQVASIVGAAGIGKTRLAEEFLQRAAAHGCAVYRAYCDEHSAEPLQPIRQMFPATAAAVPAPNQGAVLRELLSRLASAQPLVLFIDDWQWADDATRTALAAVRELETSRIVILTTSRVDDTAVEPSVESGIETGQHLVHDRDIRIALSPLDTDAALQTIRALLRRGHPFSIHEVMELAGGNPLYIEELCYETRQHTVRGQHERKGHLPAWLCAVIESRVADLTEEEAKLVQGAAVIGTVVPGWLLEGLTGYAKDHPLVARLSTHDVIFRGGTDDLLRFRHGITREVIYESVNLDDRRDQHLRVARLLEEHAPGGVDEHLEALAYHYRAAQVRDLAANYAERAGVKAQKAAALDRARTQYSVALDLIDPADEQQYGRWVEIAQRFGLSCVYDPDPEQLPILQRAVALAAARHDEGALARMQYWLGYVYYSLGEPRLAITHLEEAQRSCARAGGAAGNYPLQVLATLGQAHAAACEYDEAEVQLNQVVTYIDDASRLKDGERGRPSVGSAYTRACLGAVLGDMGRFDEAHASFARALDAVREGNHPVKGSVLGLQGLVCAWQERWADALAYATEAEQIGERVESLYVLAINQTLRGYAQWRLERAPEAIDAILRAVSWLEARGKRLFISPSYGWLAEAMLETRRYDEARFHAAQAIRRARRRDRFGEAAAYRVLTQLPEHYRRHAPAYYLERAFEAARRRRSPHEEALTRDVAAALRR